MMLKESFMHPITVVPEISSAGMSSVVPLVIRSWNRAVTEKKYCPFKPTPAYLKFSLDRPLFDGEQRS